jgi:hypothetical protein
MKEVEGASSGIGRRYKRDGKIFLRFLEETRAA